MPGMPVIPIKEFRVFSVRMEKESEAGDEYLAPGEGDFGNEEGGLQDDWVMGGWWCFPQKQGAPE